jgi:isoleucyl-tRNA synthetase
MDYADDVRMSERGIKEMSEAYRKIRNTFRYLLGNLEDYAKSDHAEIAREALHPIDRWALYQLNRVIEDMIKAYRDFEFYRAFQRIYQFCSVELSSFYLDVLKDRLYAELPDGPDRRAAQFVMARLHSALTRLLAPIIPHTTEELWELMPASGTKEASVHLAEWPAPEPEWNDESRIFPVPSETLLALRADVLRELEKLRVSKTIGSSQEAAVEIGSDDPQELEMLQSVRGLLETFCIVSEVQVGKAKPADAVALTSLSKGWVRTTKSAYAKCERCWNLRSTVGQSQEHPTLCERCVSVISVIGVGN